MLLGSKNPLRVVRKNCFHLCFRIEWPASHRIPQRAMKTYQIKITHLLECLAREFKSPDEVTLLREFLSRVKSDNAGISGLHATMFLQKEEEIWRLVSMISTVSATNPQIASAFKFEVLESSWKQGETVISQTNIDKASKVSNGHFPNTFLPTILNLTQCCQVAYF